jgi:hypothetical protein
MESCSDLEMSGRMVMSVSPEEDLAHAVGDEKATGRLGGVPASRLVYPTPDPSLPPWHNGPRGSVLGLIHNGLAYSFELIADGGPDSEAAAQPYLDALDQILATVKFGPSPGTYGEWTHTVMPVAAPPATPSSVRADLPPPTYHWSFFHPAEWHVALEENGSWTLQAPAGGALSLGSMTIRGEPAVGAPEEPYGDGTTAFHPVLGGWGYRLPDEETPVGLRWRWLTRPNGGPTWQVTTDLPPLDPNSAAYDLYLGAALLALADSGFGWAQPFPPDYPGPAPTSP